MGVAASTKYAYDRLKKKLGRNPTAGETKAIHTRVKSYFSTPGRETEMPAGWQPGGQSAAKKGKAMAPRKPRGKRVGPTPGRRVTPKPGRRVGPGPGPGRRVGPTPRLRAKPVRVKKPPYTLPPEHRKRQDRYTLPPEHHKPTIPGPGKKPPRRVGPVPRKRKLEGRRWKARIKPRGKRISR